MMESSTLRLIWWWRNFLLMISILLTEMDRAIGEWLGRMFLKFHIAVDRVRQPQFSASSRSHSLKNSSTEPVWHDPSQAAYAARGYEAPRHQPAPARGLQQWFPRFEKPSAPGSDPSCSPASKARSEDPYHDAGSYSLLFEKNFVLVLRLKI